MYKSKRYAIRPLNEIQQEIEALARAYPHANKVFLADGDAFALPTDHLAKLLRLLYHPLIQISPKSSKKSKTNPLFSYFVYFPRPNQSEPIHLYPKA